MKFIKAIHPKNLLQFKISNYRRISKSELASFNTLSSGDARKTCQSTPTSELHASESARSLETAPQTLELVEAFKLIDRDGDGKISKCELQTVLSRISAEPPSEEELTAMLTEIDLDGDGCISLEELGAIISREELGAIRSEFGPAPGMEEIRETFEVFDADHNGRISAEELLTAFSAIGDGCTLSDCKRMMAGVDVDGDGFLCFEEFTKMMAGAATATA